MMITNIGSFSHVQGIYVYGNSHYNQMANTAVAPISKVPSVAKLEDREDELKLAVTYLPEEESRTEEDVVLREKGNLAENYKNQDIVQYNMSNPYELARMSIENTILSGMNFDMLA